MRAALVGVSALLASACAATAAADDPPPVQQGALMRGLALPNLGRAEVLEAGRVRRDVEFTSANEYAFDSHPDETVTIDGEAEQLSYEYRRGLGDGWDAGLFIPVLAQGGGWMDSLIEGWHQTLGLPNGGRQYAPYNRYLYTYVRGPLTQLNVTQGGVAIGDLQFGVGRRITRHLVARAMLKLPTGDASHLAGDGAIGGALWLDGELPLRWPRRVTAHASFGESYTARGHVLPELRRRAVLFGAVGFDYGISARWGVGLQLYVHEEALHQTGLEPLTRIGAPWTLRGVYRVSAHRTLQFGFQEKAVLLGSPDFGFFGGMQFD